MCDTGVSLCVIARRRQFLALLSVVLLLGVAGYFGSNVKQAASTVSRSHGVLESAKRIRLFGSFRVFGSFLKDWTPLARKTSKDAAARKPGVTLRWNIYEFSRKPPTIQSEIWAHRQ